MNHLPRRRFLSVAAGVPLLGSSAGSVPPADGVWRWRGVLLGAQAELVLCHRDRAVAEHLLAEVHDEIARLEDVFSLHRPHSEIRRLNREGVVANPSHDLLLVVQYGLHLARMTRGAFDITVQPLWRLYAEHFARDTGSHEPPPADAVAAARERVGWQHVRLAADRIGFARPGMAITLNGLAQGYITDRIADLLGRRGLGRALVSLGEHRALGEGPAHGLGGWHVGVRDPRQSGRTVAGIRLQDRAMATSGGYGTPFSRDGRHHHLLDPATGTSAGGWASVSVVAATATVADGWSTALAILPEAAGIGILRDAPWPTLQGAILVRHDGSIVRIGPV